MNKGFFNIVTVVLAGVALIVASGFFVRSGIDRQWSDTVTTLLGTVSTTQLTDTINTFRTNVNGDLFNLNADLRYTTTTDPGHKHTTSTTTGVFSGTNGGIGTTTLPSDAQYFGANGTVPTWKAFIGTGAITITPTTTSTIINSTAFSTSTAYNWSSLQTFQGGVTSTAATTLSGNNTFSGTTTISAPLTISGNVTVGNGVTGLGTRLYSSSTNVVITDGTETNLFSFTLSSSTLSTENVIRGTCYSFPYNLATVGNDIRFRLKYGSVTVVTSTVSMQQTVGLPLKAQFILAGNGTVNSQLGEIESTKLNIPVGFLTTSTLMYATGTAAQASATDLTIVATAQIIVLSGTPDITWDRCYVEKIVQ